MEKYSQEFSTVKINDLKTEIRDRSARKSHFIQMCCTKTDAGYDLLYSFINNGKHEDIVLSIKEGDKVPSITSDFLAAFVFENEAHDLFGVEFTDLAIDFKGTLYKLSQDKPMNVVSPEVIARKEKQAKIEAAMAAKKARDAKKAAQKPAETPAVKAAPNPETKKGEGE